MMYRKMMFVLLLLWCASCVPVSTSLTLFTQNRLNVQHLQNSTVALVEAENAPDGTITDTLGQDNHAYCTGFFIDPNTVVTANHCTTYQQITGISENPEGGLQIEFILKHVEQVKVSTYQFFSSGKQFRNYRLFDLVGFNETDDVAVLRVHPGQQEFVHDSLKMSNTIHYVGEPTFAIGHPVGEYYTLTQGIISRDTEIDEDGSRWVFSSANIFFGNSGGPLVDNNGDVIGIAHAIAARQSHLGIWADIFGVRKLLRSIHYVLQTTRY